VAIQFQFFQSWAESRYIRSFPPGLAPDRQAPSIELDSPAQGVVWGRARNRYDACGGCAQDVGCPVREAGYGRGQHDGRACEGEQVRYRVDAGSVVGALVGVGRCCVQREYVEIAAQGGVAVWIAGAGEKETYTRLSGGDFCHGFLVPPHGNGRPFHPGDFVSIFPRHLVIAVANMHPDYRAVSIRGKTLADCFGQMGCEVDLACAFEVDRVQDFRRAVQRTQNNFPAAQGVE
jgi:hypothetical protein